MRRTMLALGLMVAVESATAVTMIGGADCGKFVASPASHHYWLAGYLSGLNAALASNDSDPLKQLGSIEQASLWLQKYCRENPLGTLQHGANLLYVELKSKGPAK